MRLIFLFCSLLMIEIAVAKPQSLPQGKPIKLPFTKENSMCAFPLSLVGPIVDNGGCRSEFLNAGLCIYGQGSVPQPMIFIDSYQNEAYANFTLGAGGSTFSYFTFSWAGHLWWRNLKVCFCQDRSCQFSMCSNALETNQCWPVQGQLRLPHLTFEVQQFIFFGYG